MTKRHLPPGGRYSTMAGAGSVRPNTGAPPYNEWREPPRPFPLPEFAMLRFAVFTAVAAAVCVLVSAPAPAAEDDTMLKVKEGDKFPDVPLAAAQIEKVKKDAK